MESKRRRFYENLFTPAALALVLISLSAFGVVPINDFHRHYLGIAAGFFGGYASIILLRWRTRTPRRWSGRRIIGILVSPLAVIYLLPFSKPFATGYWIGGGVSFCLLFSFEEFLKSRFTQGIKRRD